MASMFGGRRFGRARPGGGSRRVRLLLAAVVAGVALIGYFSQSVVNPVTGQKQRIAMTVEQEIALGLQSAPEMAAQFGGLSSDRRAQELVDRVGGRILAAVPKAGSVYPFDFHVLADARTVNAFALPGGQIFITEALLSRLETEGQVAGVLGHEVAHVIHRHSAEHLAKAQLTQGLTGAAVLATYDPQNPSSRGTAAMAALVGQMINMRYGRDDELESDREGVRYMAAAGYDPRSMIRVMEVLAQASGGAGPPEFFSTHPNPDRRIERIQEAIAAVFPGGVPEELVP